MRRYSLRAVAALALPAMFATPAALAQGYGDDYPAAIALFSEKYFYGEIRDVFDPFATLSDLRFNDRPRSVAVFGGQWELCEHKNFTGRCVFITEDVDDLSWFGLSGRVTSVRPIYEYTEARHGLMFSRDTYGYIRYAHNETYGYDTWNYGYSSSVRLSVQHYGYSPDYWRFGYYDPSYRISGDFEFVGRIFGGEALKSRYFAEVWMGMETGGASTGGLKSKYILNKEILRACRSLGIRTNWANMLAKYPMKLREVLWQG